MCFIGVTNTLHDAYEIAGRLEHRGKDSTGLIAVGENGIDVVKWKGPVEKFGNRGLQRLLPRKKYQCFAIHGRYKTRGTQDITLDEAHPHYIGGTVMEDDGNLRLVLDVEAAMIHNGQFDINSLNGLDKNKLKTSCDTEAGLHYVHKFGVGSLLQNVKGSYALAYAQRGFPGIKVARDRFGFMPGYMAKKDGLKLIASESCAFRGEGVRFLGDISPGSLIEVFSNGDMTERQIVESSKKGHCFFQFNYFANPHSVIDRINVMTIRQDLCEKLAEEFPIPADYVLFAPESPEVGAETYSRKSGIPLLEAFLKVNGTRSFLQPTQKEREKSLRMNLKLLPGMVEKIRDKRVIVIEDSAVRGTVAKEIDHLLFDVAKVSEAHLLCYTPQLGIIDKNGNERGCVYGIDMPPIENENHRFLARNKSLEQMSRETGQIKFGFISPGAMYEVFERRGMHKGDLCASCIGGRDPIRKYAKLTIGQTK